MPDTPNGTSRALVTRTGGFGYRATRGLIRAVQTLCTRARVTGLEHFPQSGGVLVVSNHVSIADPVILIAASPRPLVFMAKEDIFRARLRGAFLRWFGGVFPVRRGQNDIRAVRDALELIRAGQPLVVFPEGTRHPEGLGRALPGVGYLARRAECPILPVAIVGTEHIRGFGDLRRHPPFEIRFGEPFRVPSMSVEGVDIMAAVMTRIAALLPVERQGIYKQDVEIALAH